MRASSMLNHSLKTLRGVDDPGLRMNTASPSVICASSSTSGMRVATTIDRLKFASPPTQSFDDAPGGGPAGAAAPGARGAGGRNLPAGAGDPFSARPQPGSVSATLLSCDVMASK